MKAYVLIIEGWNIDTGVSVHWSNSECATKIIALANSLLTDGSHVDLLGLALRALDNMGIDVSTHPVDVELPVVSAIAPGDCMFCGSFVATPRFKQSTTGRAVCRRCAVGY
jgi:hypothetical protein